MQNFIPKNRDILLSLAALLIIVAAIYFIYLLKVFNIEIELASYDSAISFLMFFIISIILQFPIKYMTLSNQSALTMAIGSLSISTLATAAWFYSSNYTMQIISATYSLTDAQIYFKLLFGFLLLLVIMSFSYLIIYYKSFNKKSKNEQELNNLITEAELSSLKYQINPHFIFNSLNSISSLTLTSPDRAQEMTINLSTFLRKTLSLNDIKFVKVSEEIENLKLYLSIEKIRFQNRLNFEFDVESGIQDYIVPNMILQPLVENTIKHGVHENREQTKVKLEGSLTDNYIQFIIVNNYDKSSVSKNGEGIGLSNINRRLKLIYKRNDLITISKKNSLFEVKVLIPVKDQYE